MSLPIESFAIVDATAREVQPRAADILFRLWHRLESAAARRLVFAEFTFEDDVVGLIDAIVHVARHAIGAHDPQRPYLAMTPGEHAESAPLLDAALVGVMAEALGPEMSEAVAAAWRTTFRHLMRQTRTI